ncbi:MAG: YceD family protein [Pseudolabrys sp.]
MKKPANPWAVPVAIDEIPDSGLHIEIEAPAEVRTEVARVAGIRELPQLAAVFDLSRRGAAVHVSGTVKARVGQTCVVTLEPVENAVEEPVDLLFTPQAAETEPPEAAEADGEPPEPLVGGKVDLGAIAIEFLNLGIDPYPRKPGAEFAARQEDTGGSRPFAALDALKKGPGGKKP